MAVNSRTWPPGTELVAVRKTVTKDNLGIHYQRWPHYWGASGSVWNHNPYYSGSGNPGDTGTQQYYELLTQYESVGWVRCFYPSSRNLWRPTDGIGPLSFAALLLELDFWYLKGNKVLWIPDVCVNLSENWTGTVQDSAAGEQAVIDFWTALFTNTTTSPLGYTFANHPGLTAIEVSNERVKGSSSIIPAVYARATRITVKMVAQYRTLPTKVVTLSSTGGADSSIRACMLASAASIIPVGVGSPPDDGAGKQGSDYLGDAVAHHWYSFNTADTVAQYNANKANNGISSNHNIFGGTSYLEAPLDILTKWDSSSNIYGVDKATIPIWNTESSLLGREDIANYNNGGWRYFTNTRAERFNDLIRWYLPTLFQTRDGAGGLGVSFLYTTDIPGTTGSYHVGTINKTSVSLGSGGAIRLTASTSPSGGWVNNMSIVITAGVGGWSDLGLAEGAKKRFEITIVGGNILELQGTTYTGQPANNASYSEFNISWAPFPEELKQFSDLLTNNGTSGIVTFGWVHYPTGNPGVVFNVEGVGTWYTTSTGEVRQW